MIESADKDSQQEYRLDNGDNNLDRFVKDMEREKKIVTAFMWAFVVVTFVALLKFAGLW